MAFTEEASNGVQHLSALANAGVTHVHLLPSFDVATIPEWRDEQLEVDESVLARVRELWTRADVP